MADLEQFLFTMAGARLIGYRPISEDRMDFLETLFFFVHF